MNEASAWRIERAREYAAPYIARKPLCVIATGSAAKGLADAYSDLDIMVYWDTVPTEWLATPPLQAMGGGRFAFQVPPDGEGAIEQYFVAGLKVDVGHITALRWDERIASVVEGLDLSPEMQKALGGFLDAVVLHDAAGRYEAWRTRIAAYPDALAVAMISANLMLYPAWALKRSMLDRDELLGFYDMMVTTAKKLMCVLAGLNRIYFSTIEPKWIAYALDRMPLKPDHAAERFNALFAADRDGSLDTTVALISDVLALVEQHMPKIDIRIARGLQGMPLAPAGPRTDDAGE